MPIPETISSLVQSLGPQVSQRQLSPHEAAQTLGMALGGLPDSQFEEACQYAFDVLAHPAGALSAFQAQLQSPQLPPLLSSLVGTLSGAYFDNPLGKALERTMGLSPEGFHTVVNRPASRAQVDPRVEDLSQALEARELSPEAFVAQAAEVLEKLTYANASIKRAQQALTHHCQDAIAQAAGPKLAPLLSITTPELSQQAMAGLQAGMQQAFEKDPALRSARRMAAFAVIFTGLSDSNPKHTPYSPTQSLASPRSRRGP